MKQSLTASFLLNSALFFAAPAAAEEPPTIEITVRVYNYAAAPANEVARAQHSASVVFAHSGVQLTWLTGTVNPELYRRTRPATRCGPAVLSLRLLPEHMEPKGGLPKGIFGFSRMAAGGGFATIANVYFERVTSMVKARQSLRGVLLGAMMAHELGHLLLGVNSHSKWGLMSGLLGPRDLAAADRGVLGFSKRESRKLRKAAVARMTASLSLRCGP